MASTKNNKEYALPDSTKITVTGHTRLLVPELLFDPQSKGGSNTDQSLSDLVWDAIRKSDDDYRTELCTNIIFSGGSTKFRGLPMRLKNELLEVDPEITEYLEFEVINPKDQQFNFWKGGKMFTQIQQFADNWVTKEDYAEHGASIVTERFF